MNKPVILKSPSRQSREQQQAQQTKQQQRILRSV